jgi:hypothetical protein
MRGFIALILLSIGASVAMSQPAPLPPSITQPPSNTPQEAPLIVPDSSAPTMVRFDPTLLTVKRTENRWHLVAGKQFLKDFGPLEREAHEAVRLVRDLHFTQYGTIPGATPAFEFWLGEDGEGQKGGFVVKNVISFNDKTLRVEQTLGAWVVRDDKLLLYNFGNDEAAAKQAFAIMKKHGFNQLGIVGMPRPVMTYLTVDPYARANRADAKVDPREAFNTLSQQGLVLPAIGYVGGRVPIQNRKLDVQKIQNDWTLVHGRETVGRFGIHESRARDALRLLQDSSVTEVVLIGKSGFPIFFANGKVPRPVGLGFGTTRLNPAQMKVQMVNNNYFITEGVRTIFSFGDNRADAELVLKVLQHFQFDQVVSVGDPERGGIRLFSRSK